MDSSASPTPTRRTSPPNLAPRPTWLAVGSFRGNLVLDWAGDYIWTNDEVNSRQLTSNWHEFLSEADAALAACFMPQELPPALDSEPFPDDAGLWQSCDSWLCPARAMNLTSIPQLARNAIRVGEVVAILSKYQLADWLSGLDLEFAKGFFVSEGKGLTELTQATRIRMAINELGPSFIKLGQMLSTRPDLVGPDLSRELTKLQTGVPADPPPVVRQIIEHELGQPPEAIYARFDDVPIASASIGQVHRAWLHDGTEVVVKVQHKGIQSKVRTDLDIMTGLAELLEQYRPDLRRYRLLATAREFQRSLLRELNFGREERNLQQFGGNFISHPSVRIPKSYPEFTTARVLTMDYLEGTRLTDRQKLDSQGINLEEMARRGAEAFLEMIFTHGFYHADPHPGNILVIPPGVIGLLDFGMVGHVDEQMREDIEGMLTSILERDVGQLTSIITRVGSTPADMDHASFSYDLTDFVSHYAGQSLAHFDLGGALNDMTEIIRRYNVALPAGYAMLIKVLIMLEGTGRLLSPQFNLIELIRPYHEKLLWRKLSPMRQMQKFRRLYSEWEHLGEVLPRGIIDIMQQVQTGKLDVHLEHKGLEPSVNRLVLGMLSSSIFLGSAWLLSAPTGPLLWGVSVPGTLACGVSLVLAVRLLWAIRKSGHLDRRL